MTDNNPEWWSIEDDPDDAMFLRLAAKRAEVAPLRIFSTASAACTSLSEAPGALAAPAAILLDLNLPGMSGLQFLRWLREQEAWRYLPVIVLSSSSNPRDMVAAYGEGANAYLVKPNTIGELQNLIAAVHAFWAHVAVPPGD